MDFLQFTKLFLDHSQEEEEEEEEEFIPPGAKHLNGNKLSTSQI